MIDNVILASLFSRLKSFEKRVSDTEVKLNNSIKVGLGDALDILTAEDLTVGYIDQAGKIVTSTNNGLHSDYVSLDEFPTMYVTTSSQYSTYLGCIYDSNYEKLGSLEDFLGLTHTQALTQITDMRVTQDEILKLYPNAKYVRYSLYPTTKEFKLYQKDNVALEVYLEDEAKKTERETEDKFNISCSIGNPLYGKKYVACGDSFTEGDFTGYVDDEGLSGKNSSVIYDSDLKMYKTYPWWIAKRNGMTLVNEAKCGSDFTNVDGASNPFSVERYLAVPTDADYITMMFGLNEASIGNDSTLIGTKDDTDNTTLWGAYNVVFEHFLTNMPYAKIGVIIPDAWMPDTYANALKEICEYWGVPYLDLKGDVSVPMGIGGKYGSFSAKAKQLRDNAFKVSDTNGHPNIKAHEYRSTVIENFLRSL